MSREDEWRYHQDARDEAMAVGCFVVASIVLAAIVLVLSAMVA